MCLVMLTVSNMLKLEKTNSYIPFEYKIINFQQKIESQSSKFTLIS